MPVKSSRFVRTSYANRAAVLANELEAWSKIYSSRAYMVTSTAAEQREQERREERSEVLGDLVLDLRRVVLRLLAMQ